VKTGAECVYDPMAVKKDDKAQLRDRDSPQHGVKRRREMSRPIDSDMEEAQSSVGGLKDFAAGHGAAAAAQQPRRGSQAIEARLDKLTNMIEKLSKANGSLSVEEMNRQLHAIHRDVEKRNASKNSTNNHGERTASHSRPSSPKKTADSSGDEFPVPSGNATDLVDPIGSLNLGHLSIEDGGKSRYG
jgi:TolA-binding protein